MPTVLITGAGRGIGLEFARQYAVDGWRVIATVRGDSSELEALGVEVETLDMRDFAALEAFPRRLGGEPLELFIANAGITAAPRIDGAAAAEAWQEVHAVNAVAPVLLAEALLPNVRAARGKLAAITSRMGSIADSSGGYVGYRASKAAVNAAWRALALDHRHEPVAYVLLHPGWAQTDMGGPSATLPVEESVNAMRRVIERLTARQSGAFLDFRGATVPW
ncbi:MAG TPA: SDR family oxidoreductase [Allosphingosinicella sp.]|jgi:NAD(P)-dependent dehydrogenase (short-subunit alcohol dehydrogenase family)|nr:SDR family oxidoreductase [Allosphingosinicella sp.]